jgi:hypothetical protein
MEYSANNKSMCACGGAAITGVIFMALVFFQPLMSHAFLSYPIYIGASQPIQDEFGRNLIGAASLSTDQCDRVEILMTTDGLAYPPQIDGSPDPRNLVITGGVSSIGSHTAMGLTNSGLFCVRLDMQKPAPGTRLFVRVFNAPTRDSASFYGDSAVFTLHSASNNYEISIVSMTPLDGGDSDGDGLNNSVEKSVGSDPEQTDSDGDGMSDAMELRAGMDPTDQESVFVLANVRLNGSRMPVLSWASAAGKRYQVESTSDALCAHPHFVPVGDVVTATGSITELTVPQVGASAGIHYRIRLVEE